MFIDQLLGRKLIVIDLHVIVNELMGLQHLIHLVLLLIVCLIGLIINRVSHFILVSLIVLMVHCTLQINPILLLLYKLISFRKWLPVPLEMPFFFT